ncbi:MAG: glutathione binding-like protein [Rhodocyclaceae bacterium]|jgi:GSH-dependent disulfide-bond oxidoreductase
MIDLYTWGTPNGRKVSVMLEECGLPYVVHPVDIMAGAQFAADFIAISPNSKIPAIVDAEGPGGEPISLFESGAILIYLSEKVGRFMPADTRGRYDALQWLMFQMAGVGPVFGQAHHFLRFAKEKVPYAIERFKADTARLYKVLDARLAKFEYLAGEYSVADIATYPWVARHEIHETDLATYPAVRRWFETISARPAVQRGMAIPESPKS